MTDGSAQIQEDALNVLRDVLLWELSPARWEEIAGILEALAADLELGDLGTLAEATVELALAGPVRITRIGATPTEPPPPPVRERINQLIHSLSGKARDGT